MTLTELLQQMSVETLFEIFKMKQEPLTVSDTQEVNLPIMAFKICYFAALKDVHSKQRQKMNT